MVSMGWRKEKSVLRERVVGKVGEKNQAGSQPGLTRDTLQLSRMESTRAGKSLGGVMVGREERKIGKLEN